jgi:hypothetical protein
MRAVIVFSFLVLVITGCNSKAVDKTVGTAQDSTMPEKRVAGSTLDAAAADIADRLKITGDFNGDGRTDTLYESYISAKDRAETRKRWDTLDWERNVELVIYNEPVCRLYTNIPGADTFVVTKDVQHTGIELFENLGNLDGEKGDELGYIVDWADLSNLNHYHIISFKQGKWVELFNFTIHETMMYEREYLFDNGSVITKNGPLGIRYKFYSDSATMEEGRFSFRK